jgi:D-xylose transport system permease protein
VLKLLKQNATLLALITIGIVLSIFSPDFLSARNLSNLSRQVTIVGIMSVGMTMVILINGIDLAVGSIVGLSAVIVTLLMKSGVNLWLACLITLLASGTLVGLWNGFWIARYKIPPFIITLGMMTIARGLALTLSGGSSIPATDPIFQSIGGEYLPLWLSWPVMIAVFALFAVMLTMSLIAHKFDKALPAVFRILITAFFAYAFLGYLGIPIPVALFAIIAFVGHVLLTKSCFGRRLYAIGGNEEAARLSGVRIFSTKLAVYAIVSTLAALGGILLASRLNGASPNLGTNFELDTIAAVVIGGTSLSGGIGTITGSGIGTFLIGVMDNGMSLLGVNSFYQLIAKGALIILAVGFDIVTKRKSISASN